MSSQPQNGGWAELLAPRYLATMTTLCLGVALFAFNAFLASTALPTAVQELQGVALISWALTLYLVFAIMGGVGAALTKKFLGARNTLLLSAVIFLCGTLVAANANSMPVVLAGRALQGSGEGVMAAVCFALIPELFPSRLVPKVFGTQAMVWAVAAFGGPVLAGLLTELVSWRAAFLVNVPIVLIFIALVTFIAPNSKVVSAAEAFPGIRLLLIGGGIMCVAFAGLVGPLFAAGLLLAAALLLVSAILLDRRSPTQLLPGDAFRLNSVLGAGFWIILLMPVAGASGAVYLVLVLQEVWNYGPTAAGAVGAVMAVAWSVSAITVANVHDPRARLTFIRIGPALLMAGLCGILVAFWLGLLPVLILAQCAVGAGFGMCFGYTNQTIMEAASATERDRASALLPTLQSAGNAIGAAIAGLAANSAGFAMAISASDYLRAIVPVFTVAALIALLAWACALRMTNLASSAMQPVGATTG